MTTTQERSLVPNRLASEGTFARPVAAPAAPIAAPADSGSRDRLAARVAASSTYGHRLDRLRAVPSPAIQRTRVRFGSRHADEIDLAGNEKDVQQDVHDLVNRLVQNHDGPGLKKLLLGARRHGFGQVENRVAGAILENRRQELPRVPGRERPFKIGSGASDPPSPGALPVRLHGKSRGALKDAPHGSPMMGIVHLRRNENQQVSSGKIFVHGSEPNADFPMADPSPASTSIYGNKPLPPVTHVNRNVRDYSTPSGHQQVADLLLGSHSSKTGKPKFSEQERDQLKSEPGHFLGFSVQKSAELLPHRLSYTSATYNPGTFPRDPAGLPIVEEPPQAQNSNVNSNSAPAPKAVSKFALAKGFGQFLAVRQQQGQSGGSHHHPTHYQVTQPWARAINARINAHIDPEHFTIGNVGPGGHEDEDGQGGTLKYTGTPHGIFSAWTPRNYQPPEFVPAPEAPPPPQRDRRRPPALVGGVKFRYVDSIGRKGGKRR